MAALRAEVVEEIPVSHAEAHERLPLVMERLGYEKRSEGIWERRKDRFGFAFLSLPDACPTTLRIDLKEIHSPPRKSPCAAVHLHYLVRMPGQILANTDARALELEVQRFRSLMIGEAEPDLREERKRLVALTMRANLVISLLPAVFLLSAIALDKDTILRLAPMKAILWMLLLGGMGWGVGLFIAVKSVVPILNALIPSTLRYTVPSGSGRSAKKTGR